MRRFKEHLAEQLRFIQKSCREFDRGDDSEAQRIAVALRIIFHQTGKSDSLLTHLGAKSLSMLSTASSPVTSTTVTAPCNLASLVVCRTETGVTFTSKALLDEAPVQRFFPFADWWNAEIICLTSGAKMTRKSLILAVANKDGGAHVDANLPSDYAAMKSGAGMFVVFQPDGGDPVEIRLDGHCAATLRQIGHEVLHSHDLVCLAL